MKIIIGIVFFLVIAYHLVNFIQLLMKMNEKIIFPANDTEAAAIRKHPERALDPPTYKAQKVGIIIYVFMLLFLLGVFFVGASVHQFDNWAIFLFMLLPFSYSHDMLNMFGVLEGGLLVGSRFIPWNKVTSVQFKRIDINHKYYGFSKEVNDSGYELIIKQRFFSRNCIVTSIEMKETLTEIFRERVDLQEEELVEEKGR
ncbi:hypothetical protein SAMN05216389_10145 [Oceanobacillus limi]|uniref:DUF5673 domain-containing protein n=1 Tax=Oceanobacillus limi TaxID=930131 RepID=A0A1H9XZF3_9BACI|nr:hypothetical protein [Oceanobacillus limi]SES61838.1 hypothetical protein SAMN05216389_10145 [Oceanobacillus limi]